MAEKEPATARPLRVVVVGQIPPPISGQFVAVGSILEELRGRAQFDLIHLPFRFAKEAGDHGVFRLRKLVEVVRIWGRALAASGGRRFDVVVYPIGGPSTASLFRDLLVLPLLRLLSRSLVLHFHAGGHAEVWSRGINPLAWVTRAAYRRADLALVMTAFNRRDPEKIGIPRIKIVPHRIKDEFDPGLVRRNMASARFIYIGHIRAEKGFPELLEAFAEVAADEPDIYLDIAGEIVPPLTEARLTSLIRERGLHRHVTLLGRVEGPTKNALFGGSSVLVFPTRAVSESFGLVLIEAMMWSLPVVASEWRGNRDVLGDDGGVYFSVGDDFQTNLARALRMAIQQRDQWSHWGSRNRRRFLQLFSLEDDRSELVDVVRDEGERAHRRAPSDVK